MEVSEIMSRHVICIRQDESVAAAARLLKRHNLGSIPVCGADGRVRGMLTDRDIVLRCVALGTDPEDTHVSEIMSRGITSASPHDSIEEAATLMSGEQIRRLPVVENGKPVGMLALCDLVRSSRCQAEAASTLSEISSNLRRRRLTGS